MKKLFKNSYIALAVLALGFSACTEQVEYTPAAVPATAQVYFSSSNTAQVDLAQDAKSFDIPVSRAIKGEEATVAVTVTADSLANEIFDFPANVKFAAEDSTAIYTIAVKEGVVLEYEMYYNVALALGDDVATPYGKQTHTFTVGVPAPWSEWALYNKGNVDETTYTYACYWSGVMSEVSVYYREYLLNTTDAEFLLPEMAGGFDLKINYNRETGACEVPVQQVAVHSSYGPVYVSDMPHYPLTEGLTYDDYPCSFDVEKGKFSLNLIYFVSADLGSSASGYFAKGEEVIQLGGFFIPDYSFAMEFKGHYVDAAGTDNAVISTTPGADVAKYLLTVIGADEDANATVLGMLDGSVACDTLTEGGFYAYPMTESGNKMALAITLDAEGNALSAYAEEFEFFLVGEDSPWESLGYATYTDDIVSVYLQEPYNYSYKVEVRESKDQPGLYRIINPYEFFGADTSKEYFIEIDATDPAGVIVNGFNDTGLDIGAGNILVSSYAYYLLAKGAGTFEEIKDAGLCGTLADGVITFPVKGLIYAMGENLYFGNTMGAFALDLNSLTATPDEAAARKVNARNGINFELNNDNVMGANNVAKCKKIDNSFLSLKGCEVE